MLADFSSFISSVWACALCGCLGFGAGWFIKGKYGHKF